MKPISLSDKKPIFENQFVRLYSVEAKFEDHTKEYFVTEKGIRAGVLLIKDNHVLLVRQYRFLINDYSWELPGGGVKLDESPEQAIERECREEAGIVCHILTPLFDYLMGTDVSDNRVFLYYCTDFNELADGGDGMETDAWEWVPLETCFRRVMAREIKDLMTITALMMYRYQKEN